MRSRESKKFPCCWFVDPYVPQHLRLISLEAPSIIHLALPLDRVVTPCLPLPPMATIVMPLPNINHKNQFPYSAIDVAPCRPKSSRSSLDHKALLVPLLSLRLNPMEAQTSNHRPPTPLSLALGPIDRALCPFLTPSPSYATDFDATLEPSVTDCFCSFPPLQQLMYNDLSMDLPPSWLSSSIIFLGSICTIPPIEAWALTSTTWMHDIWVEF